MCAPFLVALLGARDGVRLTLALSAVVDVVLLALAAAGGLVAIARGLG